MKTEASPSTDSAIEIKSLSRRFGSKLALDNVSLTVSHGVVFGLVGENGAGKTTLIKHILGLLKAQSGSVRVFGLDPVADPVGVLGRVGYLSEQRDLPLWMRVDELLRYTHAFYPKWDAAYAEQLRQQFGLDPASKIKSLSRGECAKAGLLLALAHRPDLLLLDEPSSGLDPVVRRDILEAIIRTVVDEGRTVFFSSHLLDEIERVSDHVAMVVNGRLVLSGPHDAMRAIVCLLMMLPAAYLCARLRVQQQRRGRWQIPQKARWLIEVANRKLFLRKRPFATSAQAQRWMEWRRNAVTPSIALGIGLVIVCGYFVRLATLDDLGAIASSWSYIVGALLTLWAFISGVLLARDASSKSLALSSFLATRPVTSGELAFAKIKLAAWMSLVGWLIYGVALFFWFNFFGARPDTPIGRWDDAQVPTMGFVALALAWHLAGALPLWLTGRVESAAWAGLLLLGGYIALGNAIQFLDKHFGLLVALPLLFTFGLIAKILIAVWAFREANRRRLLSPRATVKYFAFWLVGTMCFVTIAAAICQGMVFPQPLVTLGAALLLPLARVGLASLALAWGRHR